MRVFCRTHMAVCMGSPCRLLRSVALIYYWTLCTVPKSDHYRNITTSTLSRHSIRKFKLLPVVKHRENTANEKVNAHMHIFYLNVFKCNPIGEMQRSTDPNWNWVRTYSLHYDILWYITSINLSKIKPN